MLVFEFDILMGYAVSAVIVAVLVGRGEKTVRRAMWVAGGLHVVLFGTLSAWLFVAILQDPGALSGSGIFAEGAARVYESGAWWDQVQFRIDNALLYRLDFLFLLGVRLMRSGTFSPEENGVEIRRRMLHWGLLLGVPLNLLYFVPNGLFELPVRYLFAPILSLGYAGLMMLAVERGGLPWLTARGGRAPGDCARATAREGLSESRRLVRALRPELLEGASLPEALGRLDARWSDASGTPARLSVTGKPCPMSMPVEVTLLRAAQESLQNVQRHAGAESVDLHRVGIQPVLLGHVAQKVLREAPPRPSRVSGDIFRAG